MYLDYFGLDKDPFTISPDPAFLYPSPQHRQALAHLKYGLDREGGFILLTGEVGTGKTTLTRLLLEQLPGNVRVAYILNTKLNSEDVLASICQDLSLEYESGDSIKHLTDLIYKDLLETHSQGKKTLLVLEEAQNLDPDVLETLRLLTNLETNTTKLLHILLVGQPELQELLARNELRQLNQRVVSRFHIEPLDLQETTNYLNHRLRHAGSKRQAFDGAAIKQLHKLSGGIPRMLNLLAERSLLGAYATNANLVDARIVRDASKEVLGEPIKSSAQNSNNRSSMVGLSLRAGLAVLLTVAGIYYFFFQNSPQPTPAKTGPVSQNSPEQINSPERVDSPERINSLERINSPEQLVSSRNSEPAAQTIPVEEPARPTQTSIQEATGQNPPLTKVEQQNVQAINAPEPQTTQAFFTNTPAAGAVANSVDRVTQTGKNTYEQLLALWFVEAKTSNQKSFCLTAEINNLRCKIEKDIDLGDLAEINRPGLVTVLGDQDIMSLYLVSFFDGYSIRLTNSSGTVSLSASDFADVWDGRFVYVWKPPPAFARTLYPGVRDSKMVRWTQDKLQVVFDDYEYIIGGGAYSQPIVRAVARFQTQQGLEADGLLGPRTILRLMDQTDNLPRLDQPAAAGRTGGV